MSGEHAVLYSFALYCLAVLLPVVPATIIFKLFPDTKVSVTGPLQNLSLKTTGAFAAYVVTAILGFMLIQNVIRQIDLMASTTWTVVVPVKLMDGNNNPLAQPATVSFIVNFDPNLYRTGDQNVYVTFPQSRSGDWPTLHFGLPGFENGKLDVQQVIDGKDAKVAEIDAAARRITIKRPVTLTALAPAFANVEYKDTAPLQPIDVAAAPK
jgi:hypothetical protein